MSAQQVRNAIISGFEHLSLEDFAFLNCSGLKLEPLSTGQDGAMVIDAAQAKKGVIYIGESTTNVNVSLEFLFISFI